MNPPTKYIQRYAMENKDHEIEKLYKLSYGGHLKVAAVHAQHEPLIITKLKESFFEMCEITI